VVLLAVVLVGGMMNRLVPNLWSRPAVGSAIFAAMLLALVVLLRREEKGRPG
jgi:hypothetical protein